MKKPCKKLNKKQKIMWSCLAVLMAGVIVGLTMGFLAIPYDGTECTDIWSAGQTFNLATDTVKTMDIQNSKHVTAEGKHQFVILNLADIQLDRFSGSEVKKTFNLIDKLVEEIQPDLITLTGDQVGGAYIRRLLKQICKQLDSYGIPWAPVLGNHDGEHDVTRNGNGDIYLRYKNVVFAKNAAELGVGNYIINIQNGSTPIHTVFMMDSHNERTYADGTVGYDYIWSSQISWYEWAVKGIQKANDGKVVSSSCFFHIPLYEYQEFWNKENGTFSVKDGYTVLNENRENVCCANYKKGGYNNGFFAKMVELGSTKNVIVGHDHRNNSCCNYQGINLAYAMKSGYGSYYDTDMLGGTTVTVNEDGSSFLTYHYYQDNQIISK